MLKYGAYINENRHEDLINRNEDILRKLMGFLIKDKFKFSIENNKFRVKGHLEEDDDDESYTYTHYEVTFDIDYTDSKFNAMQKNNSIDEILKMVEHQKEVILKLKETLKEFNIVSGLYVKKSGDYFRVTLELFEDYFDDNEDLLKSIGGINKYKL